jgi:inward rectifier potassium channel
MAKGSKIIDNFGFGRGLDQQRRILGANGKFNIRKRGIPLWKRVRLYHVLIGLSWGKFLLVLTTAYTLLNLIFATGYYLIGVDQLTLHTNATGAEAFREAFFFSTQTFTSVGFGRVAPAGVAANYLASFEAFVGLLSLALSTGLLYGKFSKPLTKLLFSKHVLLTRVRNQPALVFRFANRFSHHLIEGRVTVLASFQQESGIRQFHRLTLEYDTVQFLTLNWTVVHFLDENSPLKDLTLADFKARNAELLVTVSAFDANYAQQVYEIKGYYYTDFQESEKPYAPMFHHDEVSGQLILDLDLIDRVAT